MLELGPNVIWQMLQRNPDVVRRLCRLRLSELAIANCVRDQVRRQIAIHPDLAARAALSMAFDALHTKCRAVNEPIGIAHAVAIARDLAHREGTPFDEPLVTHAIAAKRTGSVVVEIDPEPLRQAGVTAIPLPDDPSGPMPAPSGHRHLRLLDAASSPRGGGQGPPSQQTAPVHSRRAAPAR
jgi:hypothetical protein